MSSPAEDLDNVPAPEEFDPLPSVSISLQRILRDDFPSNSAFVQLNARNNNIVSSSNDQQEPSPPASSTSSSCNINEAPTRSTLPNRANHDDPDRGTTSMNPRSKRPRPPLKANTTTTSKPKFPTACSVFLEAKRNAQAQARRAARNSNGNNIEILLPEPEIIVMKDHLQPARDVKSLIRKPTGVVYDLKMLEHHCLWDAGYPEKPERLSASVERCQELGLIDRCVPLLPRYATESEVLTIHTQSHIDKLKDICAVEEVSKLEEFSSHYDAIYVHPSTYQLALLSVGCTIDLVDAVLEGRIQNGMALIRPPGHHAMESEYCGYCLFNNVAIAAKRALDSGRSERVLIVDFDVHHGQATQQAYYKDKRVLYFSIHRFEHGNFWPNLEESNYNFIGSSDGLGFNCNVPLNKKGLGNVDYLTIWHQLLLPLAYEFSPDLVIVSAGYDCLYGCFEFNPQCVLFSAGMDCLLGDDKGEMEVTPQCVPHFIWPLLGLAFGKIAVILEGGYCIKSLAEGAALTLRALLGDPCPLIPKISSPSPIVTETLLNATYMLRPYWSLLKKQQTTTAEIESEIKKRGVLHIPELKFEWTYPKQEVFLTRDCYPIQSEELKRTISERLDGLKLSTNLSKAKHKVGIVYDDIMLKHRNLQEPGHPETPERISNIFANHADYGLLERCYRINSRQATEQELTLIHSKEHIDLMKRTQSMRKSDLEKLQNNYNSIFLNSSSYEAALVSAGCVLEVVDNVLWDKCQSGVAIVRPPGHHAEEGYPCGFCVFNNVALAAKYAIENHGLKRILIVDWDVHHGNGIQRMFESDPRVLYISIHRYEHGFFFPCSKDADYNVVGSGPGTGYNVNIPWNNSKVGDTEYLAVFTNIILPIAYEYCPELVLVSAGFDAAKGDPLGGCGVTPEGFGHMTHLLSSLANGKIILALEGGYNLTSIAYSMVLCTKALLGDPLPPLTLQKKINPGALQSIQNVLDTQAKYWTVLKPFRYYLPYNKRLIRQGSYTSLEEKMADLNLNNISSSSTTSLSAPSPAALAPSESPERGGGNNSNSSLEPSPVKVSPEAIKMTLVLEGACGGAAIDCTDGGGNNVHKHRVVMSNFDDSAPAAVYPLTWCPHLEQVGPVPNGEEIDTSAKCEACRNEGDNWVCITCYKAFCGRYVNQHMVQHSTETGHQLALSFADLSIWCYACESYVRNEKLFPAFSAAHKNKFNEEPPPRSFST